jgi:hypothetical protein
LPLTEVVYQLRRLDPWFLGRVARYAAFYVRARDGGGDFQTMVEVHGRPMRVRFMSAAQRSRHVRRLALLAAATGSLALVVSAAVTSALNTRAETAERLAAVEQMAAAKLRVAKAQDRRRRTEQALDAAGLRRLGLSAVLGDLAWASSAKVPAARIVAFHWDHGHLAVEARGDGAPFVPGRRSVVRAQKPLRAGVWLWGVEPAARSGAAP